MINEAACRNYVINNAVDRHNMSRELAEWVFDGIEQDIVEGWSNDRVLRWVDYGESVFGFARWHYATINTLTMEYTIFAQMATKGRNH